MNNNANMTVAEDVELDDIVSWNEYDGVVIGIDTIAGYYTIELDNGEFVNLPL